MNIHTYTVHEHAPFVIDFFLKKLKTYVRKITTKRGESEEGTAPERYQMNDE